MAFSIKVLSELLDDVAECLSKSKARETRNLCERVKGMRRLTGWPVSVAAPDDVPMPGDTAHPPGRGSPEQFSGELMTGSPAGRNASV